MIELSSAPIWGVLVEAPVEKVREFLVPLGEVFDIRTNGRWTAAFCMEPGNCFHEQVTKPLQFRGYAPIYYFDYGKYDITTARWDGKEWTLLEDAGGFVTPDKFLNEIGIKDPYWGDLPRSPPPSVPVEVRKAMVIEGASDDLARQIAGSGVRVESGPRGPIVYAPDLETRFAFWERAPGSVLELEFCPESGEFWFQIIKGEECLGTFRPGETRSWDGTPFLPSVDGETDPGTIVEKLGIPRSFVAPKPGGLRRTAAKRS